MKSRSSVKLCLIDHLAALGIYLFSQLFSISANVWARKHLVLLQLAKYIFFSKCDYAVFATAVSSGSFSFDFLFPCIKFCRIVPFRVMALAEL